MCPRVSASICGHEVWTTDGQRKDGIQCWPWFYGRRQRVQPVRPGSHILVSPKLGHVGRDNALHPARHLRALRKLSRNESLGNLDSSEVSVVDGRCVEILDTCIGAGAWFGVASSCKCAPFIPSACATPPKLRWHSDSVRSSPVWFPSLAGSCQHKGSASRSDDIYR